MSLQVGSSHRCRLSLESSAGVYRIVVQSREPLPWRRGERQAASPLPPPLLGAGAEQGKPCLRAGTCCADPSGKLQALPAPPSGRAGCPAAHPAGGNEGLEATYILV